MSASNTQLSAAATTLTFANTPLDLQITICLFLHPSDILALRKVCHQSNLLLLESFGLRLEDIYRLVMLSNLPHGNVQFGWLLFIEYVSTTLCVSQVPPYPIWVIWNSNGLRWLRADGLSSVALFFLEDVFRVVDYRTNYWRCFSVDVDVTKIGSVEVFYILVLFKRLKLNVYWVDIVDEDSQYFFL